MKYWVFDWHLKMRATRKDYAEIVEKNDGYSIQFAKVDDLVGIVENEVEDLIEHETKGHHLDLLEED